MSCRRYSAEADQSAAVTFSVSQAVKQPVSKSLPRGLTTLIFTSIITYWIQGFRSEASSVAFWLPPFCFLEKDLIGNF